MFHFYIIDIVNIFHFIWIKIKYLLFLLMIEHQIDNTFINRVNSNIFMQEILSISLIDSDL